MQAHPIHRDLLPAADEAGFGARTFVHFASVQVEGKSMSPTLPDCAVVILSTGDTRIRNGNVYAIDYQGEFYIKRLMVEPDGAVRVTSDNPDKTRYPDWTVRPEHGDVLRVLGRAVQVQNDL